MHKITWCLLASAMFGLSACATPPSTSWEPGWETTSNNALIKANYQAASSLLEQISTTLDREQPLLVATVVDINQLEQSTTLGRLISEQISGRFTQAGYRMVEMKLRNNVYVKRSQGEMMLTREIRDIAQNHAAQAVIIGTYGRSKDYVFVNIKVVQPSSNYILAVRDYALPVDTTINSLLKGY